MQEIKMADADMVAIGDGSEVEFTDELPWATDWAARLDNLVNEMRNRAHRMKLDEEDLQARERIVPSSEALAEIKRAEYLRGRKDLLEEIAAIDQPEEEQDDE
jgi:hypothetical protein